VALAAESAAIDDALYLLEKALRAAQDSHSSDNGGSGAGAPLTLALFLKTTRQLAMRQFLCLAHMKKINAVVDQRVAEEAAAAAGATEGLALHGTARPAAH
jgi:hypothetical protein